MLSMGGAVLGLALLSVLLVALGAALFTGIVFALAPLAQTARTRLFEEMALALMLLTGSAMLIDAFWRLTRVESGDPNRRRFCRCGFRSRRRATLAWWSYGDSGRRRSTGS